MQLVKIIRQRLGITPWEMCKRLDNKSIQSYLNLERANVRISLADLVEIQRVSELSVIEFWDLLVKNRNKKQ